MPLRTNQSKDDKLVIEAIAITKRVLLALDLPKLYAKLKTNIPSPIKSRSQLFDPIMSVAKDIPTPVTQAESGENILENLPKDVIFPPVNPYSNEPELESSLHLQQMLLLIKCLEWWWRDRESFFAAGNLTIYYSPYQLKSEDFRGPDFFVVLDTEHKPRNSWVVWHENGKYPNIIIEILSQSTANSDRNLKKQIYQDTFRTPDYFWFDPNSLEFAGFVLVGGIYESYEGKG